MTDRTLKTAARLALGGTLLATGTGHLTVARREFQAQVPDWVPIPKDATVVLSGLAELALGGALVLAPPRYRRAVGIATAAFFAAIFPGNVAQYTEHRDGFGLDTDAKRFGRLFFQPVLVGWALLSTDAV